MKKLNLKHSISSSFSLCLGVIFLGVSLAHADGELKQKFIEASGIREGYYEQTAGAESCLQGPLKLLEVDNQVTIMLGARPLILGIGKNDQVIEEGDCTTKSNTEVSGNKLRSVRVETCKKKVTRFVTEVSIKGSDLSYVRKVFVGGKQKVNEFCILRLRE